MNRPMQGMMIVCAAKLEAAGLEQKLLKTWNLPIHVLGVGKTAAACSLTSLLTKNAPSMVLLFGVCGAYSGLQVSDLCIVTSDVLADEGVCSEQGFLTLQELGLGELGPYSADAHWIEIAKKILHAPVVAGATVSSCSGIDALAEQIAKRTNAQIETMEGAAVAYVCDQFNVPLLHIRCVSNLTGDRARAGWDLQRSVDKVQEAVATFVAALMEEDK